jgi:hypothetical protein
MGHFLLCSFLAFAAFSLGLFSCAHEEEGERQEGGGGYQEGVT